VLGSAACKPAKQVFGSLPLSLLLFFLSQFFPSRCWSQIIAHRLSSGLAHFKCLSGLSFFTWKRISCLLLYLFDLFCQKLTSLFCFPSSFWQDHSKITDAQRGELSPKAYICTLLLLVHCTLINYCVLLLDLQVTGEPVGEVRAVSGMHERKAEMARFADAFVALPGIYILVYPILFSC